MSAFPSYGGSNSSGVSGYTSINVNGSDGGASLRNIGDLVRDLSSGPAVNGGTPLGQAYDSSGVPFPNTFSLSGSNLITLALIAGLIFLAVRK